jgi:hypothetical protein
MSLTNAWNLITAHLNVNLLRFDLIILLEVKNIFHFSVDQMFPLGRL